MLNCGVFLYERKTFFRGMVMVVLRGIFGGSLATLYPFFLKSPAYFRHSRVYFKSTGIVFAKFTDLWFIAHSYFFK